MSNIINFEKKKSNNVQDIMDVIQDPRFDTFLLIAQGDEDISYLNFSLTGEYDMPNQIGALEIVKKTILENHGC